MNTPKGNWWQWGALVWPSLRYHFCCIFGLQGWLTDPPCSQRGSRPPPSAWRESMKERRWWEQLLENGLCSFSKIKCFPYEKLFFNITQIFNSLTAYVPIYIHSVGFCEDIFFEVYPALWPCSGCFSAMASSFLSSASTELHFCVFLISCMEVFISGCSIWGILGFHLPRTYGINVLSIWAAATMALNVLFWQFCFQYHFEFAWLFLHSELDSLTPLHAL